MSELQSTKYQSTLQELLRSLSDHHVAWNSTEPTHDLANTYISNITGDSRQVSTGTLFVARAGDVYDGHRFIPNAVEYGAAAIMGEKRREQLALDGIILPERFPYWSISDAQQALAILSAAFYGLPSQDLMTIGITGTDGKTTTASILESILARATTSQVYNRGKVGLITTVGARICGADSDTGFHVTTPDAPDVQHFLAQMRDANCDYAIIESTSQGLAQGRVAAIDFNVAAVTNITHEHIDWHGSWDAYAKAKALLFQVLYNSPITTGNPRCAVLNVDDEASHHVLTQILADAASQSSHSVSMRRYGIENNSIADVWASQIEHLPSYTRFLLNWWGGQFEVETTLLGDFNIYNVLCAATVSLALDIPPEIVQAGVKRLQGVLGRMERIDCGQQFLAIVDFAHSPASLERALKTLRKFVGQKVNLSNQDKSHPCNNYSGRLISVFGSAGLRDREKRRLMGQVSGRLSDFTVITAEDPRTEELAEINREIASGVLEYANSETFCIVPDRAEAIHHAIKMAQPGDVVASFGKGHERSMCFGTTEYPWDEQQSMRDALLAIV